MPRNIQFAIDTLTASQLEKLRKFEAKVEGNPSKKHSVTINGVKTVYNPGLPADVGAQVTFTRGGVAFDSFAEATAPEATLTRTFQDAKAAYDGAAATAAVSLAAAQAAQATANAAQAAVTNLVTATAFETAAATARSLAAIAVSSANAARASSIALTTAAAQTAGTTDDPIAAAAATASTAAVAAAVAAQATAGASVVAAAVAVADQPLIIAYNNAKDGSDTAAAAATASLAAATTAQATADAAQTGITTLAAAEAYESAAAAAATAAATALANAEAAINTAETLVIAAAATSSLADNTVAAAAATAAAAARVAALAAQTTAAADVAAAAEAVEFWSTRDITISGGTVTLGDADFDSTGRLNLGGGSISVHGNPNYVEDAISTDLFSASGADANLYTVAGVGGGGSSVRLHSGEIEVNAGAGRDARALAGDQAGAHVFNYVNRTEDLITAPEITVSLIDLNVAKGASGEVVVSNLSEKTADFGDAEALGVTIASIDIDVADVGLALVEVRNIASNETDGDNGSVNPSAFAGDIEIGAIDASAETNSSVALGVLQLASLTFQDLDAVESARVGNITIGDIDAEGNDRIAGNLTITVANIVELALGAGVSVTTSTVFSYDATVTVGSVAVGDVQAADWKDVDVEIGNVANLGVAGAIANGDLAADATLGTVTVGSVSLAATEDVDLSIGDGTQSVGQGSVTLGAMTLGSLAVVSGEDGNIDVRRIARSIDETATIGATNIAVGGVVSISSEETSDLDVSISADAQGVNGQASIGQVTVGDVNVGSSAAFADFRVSAQVSDRAASARTLSTASVAGVVIGDVVAAAAATTGSSRNAEVNVLIEAGAAGTIAVTAGTVGVAAIIGNVTLGDLSAEYDETAASASADAFIDVSVEASGIAGNATIGDVTLGDLLARASDAASIDVDVEALADRGNAEIGAVTLGDVTVLNDDGNTETDTADADFRFDVRALATGAGAGGNEALSTTIGSVSIGDIRMDGGSDAEAENVDLEIRVSAGTGPRNAGVGGSSATVGVVTVGDIDIETAASGSYDGNIIVEAALRDSGVATISGLAVGDYSVDVLGSDSISVNIRAVASLTGSFDGEATVGNVSVGDVRMVNSDAANGRKVDFSVDLNADVGGDGDASMTGVSIGSITLDAFDNTVFLEIDLQAGVEETGSATIDDIDVGVMNLDAEQRIRADIDVLARVGLGTVADAVGVASISDVQIAAISADARQQSNDVLIDVSARSIGAATVSNVSLGAIDANGDGADVEITVEAIALTTVAVATIGGDFSVSGITIGDVAADGVGEEGEIDIEVKARAEAGLASIENILIGNLDAESGLNDANVDVEIDARGILAAGGVAEVTDVTIGSIDARVVLTAATGARALAEDVDVTVDVLALGNDVSISGVSVGAIRASAAASHDVRVDINVLALGTASFTLTGSGERILGTRADALGSARISDVEFGDVSAIASNDVSADDVSLTFQVLARANVTADMTDEAATITDLTIGDLSTRGNQILVRVDISADLSSSGNLEMEARVEDVTIGNISSVGNDGAGPRVIDVEFEAESSTAINTRGEAVIRNAAVGDVSLNSGATSNNLSGLQVVFLASGERFGDIENASVGDVLVELNDGETFNALVAFSANVSQTGANEGDIDSVSVGDVTISVGSTVTDASILFSGTVDLRRDVGIDIRALDDIVGVDIGDFTVTAGARSVLDELNIDIVGGNVNSFVDDVSIGDVSLEANGANARISSDINIDASTLVGSVEVGDVAANAVGNNALVDIDANVVADAGLVGASGDVESVVIGAVSATAGANADAFVLLGVRADDDLGQVEIGDVTISAVGDGASATVDVDATAIGALGVASLLELGDVSLDANGVNAFGGLYVLLNQVANSGTIDVGDVEVSVFGSGASVSAAIGAVSGFVGDVSVGDLTIELSNSSDAGRGEIDSGRNADADFFLVIDSDDDVTVGDITLTSLVDGSTGRLNTAGNYASIDITADDAVTIGDITVVGGLYADSGVNGVSGSNASGQFNVVVIGDSNLVDQDTGTGTDLVEEGLTTLRVDDDVRFVFEYDQSDDEWFLDDVAFAPGVSGQFEIERVTGTETFRIQGELDDNDDDTDGADVTDDDIALVSFDRATNRLTIDWDDTNVGAGVASAVIDLTFAGEHSLFNHGDSVSLSVESGEVGETVITPATLALLDNFQVLDFDSGLTWLQVNGETSLTLGNIDYSGYAALQALAVDDQFVLIDVSGTVGAGSIIGAQGATEIVGNDGVNTITAGAGNDTIAGGAGADNITLGAGSDVLVFNSLTGADIIADYVVASDSIQLDNAVLTALGADGALTANEFRAGAGAVAGGDADDRIVYNTTSGDLYYDADGNGAGAAVLLATFTGAPALVVGEFTII